MGCEGLVRAEGEPVEGSGLEKGIMQDEVANLKTVIVSLNETLGVRARELKECRDSCKS